MQRINCVVLNYNDAERTAELVRFIRGFDYLEKVVVVDNASTDDSWERLLLLAGKKVDVLRAERNGGYGAGNNLGVRYSVEETGATHVIIANPDTIFSDACVRTLSRVFEKHGDVAVAAAVMEKSRAGVPGNVWPLRGFMRELLSMGPISRRLLGPVLNYPKRYFTGRAVVPVDVVHGSMLMVDGPVFLDCGGYDEGIFLYQEEAVLARKMRAAGRRTVLVTKASYCHEHSASISKSFSGQAERQRLRHKSMMYYFKKYMGINRGQELVARVWFAGVMAEIHVFRRIGGAVRKCAGL